MSGASGVRTVRVLIEGRVQGVGFRYWTEDAALELGLTGWVRNRCDGSVEALFSGNGALVAEMLDRCREGPRAAMVSSIRILEEGGAAPGGFDVLPTL